MSNEQLMAILQEAAEEQRRWQYEPPVACPRDGEPLVDDEVRRVLRCKFCGWVYQGGSKQT